MKVYEVRHNANEFRSLLFEKSIVEYKHPLLKFDGSSVAADWDPPTMWCPAPKKKAGDFWGIGSACVPAVTRNAFSTVQTHVEMAGETLPILFDSIELIVLNVTEVVNCLDHERVKWHGDGTNRRFRVDGGYHFRPDRFAESSLFLLPETCRSSRIYCTERCGDPEEDFKAAVEAGGLTGLNFIELWAD